ncbi:MAG: iron ABC transporter permease [Planctomycetota bacterium]|nr:iron ABC transporter permease [Planctomycetota bacterium]
MKVRRSGRVAVGLALALIVLSGLSLLRGELSEFTTAEMLQGLGATLGMADPLPNLRQGIFSLLVRQTLVAAGAGAALAYSGALLQGVFRNGLASPSILGITAGASVGATVVILLIGGHGGNADWLEAAAKHSPILVTAGSFVGAMTIALMVALIGGGAGRVSVPTLLLVGIAVNACLNGVLTAITAWLVENDWMISQAVFHWSFGSLDSKSWSQVALVWGAVALAASAYPLIGRELDLFAGGEEDAEGLGVHTRRVKLIVLAAASLAAASAVAVVGQIAFIGLIVPHVMRSLTGSSHRSLLPLVLLAGAVFLLGSDVFQRWVFGREKFRPGVVMSLLGGPFFLGLLIARRREVRTW